MLITPTGRMVERKLPSSSKWKRALESGLYAPRAKVCYLEKHEKIDILLWPFSNQDSIGFYSLKSEVSITVTKTIREG